MSRKQPNAYTREDIDILLDAAQVKPGSQLRDKTSIKDVLMILCRLNGMALVECMPKTNPGSDEPYTPGSFGNALQPHVLPSYKLTSEQLEGIGRLFSPEKVLARFEREGSRAEREKFARAANDTYDLNITVPGPKPRKAPQPRTSPLKVSLKDREAFSHIRAQMHGAGIEGYTALFPKDMGLEDWLKILLEETGKPFSALMENTGHETGDKNYASIAALDRHGMQAFAENVVAMVKACPDGARSLRFALTLKSASAATGAAHNV